MPLNETPGGEATVGLLQSRLFERVTVYGSVQSVGVGVANTADIWPDGTIKIWSQTAGTLDIVSDSANDTGAGTGARSVVIQGLGIDLLPVFEIIELDGATPVTTVEDYYRINTVQVLSVGTYGGTKTSANDGTITVTRTSGGAVEAVIDTNACGVPQGTDSASHYTIPINKTALLTKIVLNMSANQPGAISMMLRDAIPANVASAPFPPLIVAGTFSVTDGVSAIDLSDGQVAIQPGMDIWFAVCSETGNSDASIVYSMTLRDI